MTNYLFDALVGHQDEASAFATIVPPVEGVKPRYYTYEHVQSVSARFAHKLVNLGVEPGDRVAVQVPKSMEAVMLYLATVRCGAVFLPLNTAYTRAEVAYFIGDAAPRLFVCDPARLDEFADLATDGLALETMGVWLDEEGGYGSLLVDHGEAHTFENVPQGADDLAAILYTSGTTGRSKGAMLSHGNLLSNSQTLVECWRFTKDDVLLHALPIFHTHGLFVATNVALLAGCRLIFMVKFELDTIIQHMPDGTALMGVPTFYTRLLDDERFTRELAASMRLFVSGSAPLLAETHRAFEQRTGQRILERYGMTETNMNTSNPYDGERRAGTVGFPLPGVDLRVMDAETGEAVPNGEIGVLEVKGPNVFQGYWNMPEKTAEEFRDDGFFITGDLGRVDEDGYVHIVGRGKDLIIAGGYNIYPKEVETVIDSIDGVLESAVIGVPHPDLGEAVVAVVVLTDKRLKAEDVIEYGAEHLARFKHPRQVFLVNELPRNTMGKVQKNVLREQYAGLFNR
ncbi:MAG: malonyl-CoA synthase [Pseudomonadota bacterium]